MLLHIPPALGVTWDVMFEAVFLDLQGMVEGSIQFLYCHLDGTLLGNRQTHDLLDT